MFSEREMQREEVMVTTYNNRNSHETEGEGFSSEEWLCIGSVAPGGCGNPHPWRYRKLDWEGPGNVFKHYLTLSRRMD